MLFVPGVHNIIECVLRVSLLPRPHPYSIKGIEFDGLVTILATKTVAHKNLCIYGYAFDVASVSTVLSYVMQNRVICALPFDWDHTFLCGACDNFCGECYQALSQQLLIKRGWGLGTRLTLTRCAR